MPENEYIPLALTIYSFRIKQKRDSLPRFFVYLYIFLITDGKFGEIRFFLLEGRFDPRGTVGRLI